MERKAPWSSRLLVRLLSFAHLLGLYVAWQKLRRGQRPPRADWMVETKGVVALDVASWVSNAAPWRADGPGQLWDLIGWPEELIRASTLPADSGTDCDEFAVTLWYLLGLILDLDLAPRRYFLQVIYQTDDGIQGHHVCVFGVGDRVFHGGNWGTRLVQSGEIEFWPERTLGLSDNQLDAEEVIEFDPWTADELALVSAAMDVAAAAGGKLLGAWACADPVELTRFVRVF